MPGTPKPEEAQGLISQRREDASLRGYVARSVCYGACFMSILGPLLMIFICHAQYVHPMSQTAFVQQKDGQDFLAWFNLRPEQQSFAQIRKPLKLANETWEILSNYTPNISKTVATFSAKDAMRVMYDATKVEGVFEHVPEPLRGVFWMRGNAVPEELAVLQFGQWFPEERVYMTSVGPYNWAWPLGTPANAPTGGALYSEEAAMGAMGMMTDGAVTLSFKFQNCPASAKYCEAGEGDFSYASMQAQTILTNFSQHMDVGGTANVLLPEPLKIITGDYTLQQISKEPGAQWKRTCYWGIGACKWFEMGSYDLTKVIDADGQPFEPHYSEFLEYMGEVPIMMMTGINATSQEQLDEAKVYLRDQVDSLHDSFDERTLNV
mmetsp:Transcript_74251/g.194729  ORF Transcript_74251/g.194729 Transcript_74251/m.194729 type:complete len:378 (+) Transcript_74251:66-1199(+)